ncbi:hypothetical protein ACVXHB_05950 [Escherichia coli]
MLVTNGVTALHQDDEIGMLVRSYNLNQQLLQRHYEEQNQNRDALPGVGFANKALLMEMLEQVVAKQTTALMIITCETYVILRACSKRRNEKFCC